MSLSLELGDDEWVDGLEVVPVGCEWGQQLAAVDALAPVAKRRAPSHDPEVQKYAKRQQRLKAKQAQADLVQCHHPPPPG